jgi:membrane protein CcdC involved in cytochrome C biogenesis
MDLLNKSLLLLLLLLLMRNQLKLIVSKEINIKCMQCLFALIRQTVYPAESLFALTFFECHYE